MEEVESELPYALLDPVYSVLHVEQIGGLGVLGELGLGGSDCEEDGQSAVEDYFY